MRTKLSIWDFKPHHLSIYPPTYLFFFFYLSIKIKDFFRFWQNYQVRELRAVPRDQTTLRYVLYHFFSLHISYKPHSVHFQDLLFIWCSMTADRFMLFILPIVFFLIYVIISQIPDHSSKRSSNVAFTGNLFHIPPRYCHSFLCWYTVYIKIII